MTGIEDKAWLTLSEARGEAFYRNGSPEYLGTASFGVEGEYTLLIDRSYEVSLSHHRSHYRQCCLYPAPDNK